MAATYRSTVNRRGPLWGDCSRSGTLYELWPLEPRFVSIVSATCNSLRILPAAHRRRSMRVRTPPRTWLTSIGSSCSDRRARSRAPAASLTRAPLSRATWNWRHRVDASDGESDVRAARCDEDEHDSRAAAPNRRHSSFSYTCCPCAAYLAMYRC